MTVELLDSMGNDLAIVNAARTSYDKWHTEMSEADTGLINFLMKNRHGTPFEMVQFKFRVHTSIKVAREWQRHRIGSFNEVSTRYVEVNPIDLYVPLVENVRRRVGKPGAYLVQVMEGDQAFDVRDMMISAYDNAAYSYTRLLSLGVAPELASFVLPLGWNTTFIWSVNLRSLFNFLNLRNHERALLEIQLEAQQVEEHVRQIVPVAYDAWLKNGRVAP